MTKIKQLEQHQFKEADLNTFQGAVSRWSELVRACPLIDGVMHEDVDVNVSFLGAYVVVLKHKLGRKPQGWVLCHNQGNSPIWANQKSDWTDTQMVFASTVVNVVDLWIY